MTVAAVACAEPPPYQIRTSTSQNPLWQAKQALTADDAAGALAALENYTGAGRALADHLRARAHWLAGRPNKALDLWNRAPDKTCAWAGPSVLASRILTERVTLLQQRSPKEAAELLVTLAPDPGVWSAAIGLFEKAGETDRANALIDRLMIRFPASDEAVDRAKTMGSAALLERLKTPDRRLQRLRNLVNAHANTAAAVEGLRLAKDLPAGHPRLCETYYLRGSTARKRRRYREAVRLLRRARDLCTKKKELLLGAALIETRVRAILGYVQTTRKLVDWMVRKYPQHRFTDDAQLLLAEVLERKGRRTEAKKRYKAIAKQPDADQAILAAWRVAWGLLRADRYTAARPLLKNIIKLDGRRWDRERATYWLARTEERRQANSATERYRTLAERPSFYGWLALERLRSFRPKTAKAVEEQLMLIATATTATSTNAGRPSTLVDHPAYLDAVAYANANEPDLAAWSVRRVLCDHRDAETALGVALTLDGLGARAEAQILMRGHPTLLVEPLTAQTAHRWRAAYSKAFEKEIQDAATINKIDPLLLMALVREESTFDPTIVSWAGATGLAPADARHGQNCVPTDLQRQTRPSTPARSGTQCPSRRARPSARHSILRAPRARAGRVQRRPRSRAQHAQSKSGGLRTVDRGLPCQRNAALHETRHRIVGHLSPALRSRSAIHSPAQNSRSATLTIILNKSNLAS